MITRLNTVCRFLLSLSIICLPLLSQAQVSTAGRQVLVNAANAMGGVEEIQRVSSIRLRGYGHESYQDGGSLISTEPTAPEKMTNLTSYERLIDLENDRTRVKTSRYRTFVFGSRSMMQGLPSNHVLDGDIAYNINGNGEASRMSEETALRRRMELLANPLLAVRAALDSTSSVSEPRHEGELSLVDVITAAGAKFTLAINNTTGLPLWVRWVGPHENLGEVTFRAEFSGYLPVDGLLLPMSFNTVSDFHNTVSLRLHVDRYEVNTSVENLAAPETVRSSPAPVPAYRVSAEAVASGVWLMKGNNGANSVLIEFSDHMVLFEVPTNRAWGQAVIDASRLVVPEKPITHAIISHHHFDHTGGFRPAVAEGLTIITQSGNVGWFEELAQRPVYTYHDALSQSSQELKTLAVDDHLRLSDEQMTLDIYHTVSNAHMAQGLLAYIPEHGLLIQGDLFAQDWQLYFWGNTYADNIAYRDLNVLRDVPIHGSVQPIAEVHKRLEEQTDNARALCKQVEEAGLSMPGCPLAWDE